MKLICCARCNQIFNLSHTYQECHGGHGGGMYVNDIKAQVWGAKELIFVLGFANSSFVDALRKQIQVGDLDETMLYGGGRETVGRGFAAFIIPDAASTIVRFTTKEDYEKNSWQGTGSIV